MLGRLFASLRDPEADEFRGTRNDYETDESQRRDAVKTGAQAWVILALAAATFVAYAFVA